jgi:hypothetical protein
MAENKVPKVRPRGLDNSAFLARRFAEDTVMMLRQLRFRASSRQASA